MRGRDWKKSVRQLEGVWLWQGGGGGRPEVSAERMEVENQAQTQTYLACGKLRRAPVDPFFSVFEFIVLSFPPKPSFRYFHQPGGTSRKLLLFLLELAWADWSRSKLW